MDEKRDKNRTKDDGGITIYLNKRIHGRTRDESIANDPRLHSLNMFLDALNEALPGMNGDTKHQCENMMNRVMGAVSNKVRESDTGQVFVLGISSTSDPGSHKLTWTFDLSVPRLETA